MKINIFRNPFIDAQAGYLMDMMIDARRKETESYWRAVLEKEHQDNAIQAYNNGYIDGYSDATKAYFDDMHSFVEEQFTPADSPSESITEPDEWLFEDLI